MKRSGLSAKLIILILLLALSISLLELRGQIRSATAERDALALDIAAQAQRNRQLTDDVAQKDDPDKQEEVARDELGLVRPGERVFYNISN